MHSALNLAREVKVYIRRLIAVEAEKCLERYIMSVALELSAALRTYLVGHIKARAVAAVGDEFAVLALRAVVMRRKRIYLRNSRHARNKARADRAARADKITLTLAVPHELLRYHVQHRKAVLDDGGKLLVESVVNNLRQRIAV